MSRSADRIASVDDYYSPAKGDFSLPFYIKDKFQLPQQVRKLTVENVRIIPEGIVFTCSLPEGETQYADDLEENDLFEHGLVGFVVSHVGGKELIGLYYKHSGGFGELPEGTFNESQSTLFAQTLMSTLSKQDQDKIEGLRSHLAVACDAARDKEGSEIGDSREWVRNHLRAEFQRSKAIPYTPSDAGVSSPSRPNPLEVARRKREALRAEADDDLSL